MDISAFPGGNSALVGGMKPIPTLLIALAGIAVTHAADTLKVGEFTFTAPTPWKAMESPRPMSQGGFILPGKDTAAPLEAVFFHFGPGQGGDAEGNIKRWKGMFQPDPDPKLEREEMPFGEKKAAIVIITGTYVGSSFRPEPTPKTDHSLIAAILPSGQGDVFVRMVGPTATVIAAKEHFKKLLSSAHAPPTPPKK
jgi:hypothetical protein